MLRQYTTLPNRGDLFRSRDLFQPMNPVVSSHLYVSFVCCGHNPSSCVPQNPSNIRIVHPIFKGGCFSSCELNTMNSHRGIPDHGDVLGGATTISSGSWATLIQGPFPTVCTSIRNQYVPALVTVIPGIRKRVLLRVDSDRSTE